MPVRYVLRRRERQGPSAVEPTCDEHELLFARNLRYDLVFAQRPQVCPSPDRQHTQMIEQAQQRFTAVKGVCWYFGVAKINVYIHVHVRGRMRMESRACGGWVYILCNLRTMEKYAIQV